MKASELLFTMKITVFLYEFFTQVTCSPVNNMPIPGRPLPQILFNTNTFTRYDDFQNTMNIFQARPELKVPFIYMLPNHHPPKPPTEQQDFIMQHNYLIKPLQTHFKTILKENNSAFNNAPNPLPRSRHVEEKYKEEVDKDENYFKVESDSTTIEPFTTDYTTETTDNYDYETSTFDEDLTLRSGVSDAVAATLLG